MKEIYILFILICLCSCNIQNPSEGSKVGHIVKISHEGVFYKTCECELIRGGFVDGSGVMGAVFHFVIEDQNLISLAMDAMENNREVVIHYYNPFISSLTRSENSPPNFVTRIEVK